MNIFKKIGIVVALMPGMAMTAKAQLELSMNEVIRLAQEKSIASMTYHNTYLSSYWSYRSYRAEYLPSLTFSTTLMDFDRSLVSLQDYNTGEISYRSNYSLENYGTLSIDQNIAATGGTLSLSTSLTRLDQFDPSHDITYYSEPATLSYIQSLFGCNTYKWDKKIEPKSFEASKREYLENMEQVTINAVSYYWTYAIAQVDYDIARQNFESSKRLYKMGRTRLELGTITREDLLQLELKVLNDSLSINSCLVTYHSARNKLCSYIGYQEDADITLSLDYKIPDLALSYDEVLQTALQNSSFMVSQQVSSLEADRDVAEAKADCGVTASLSVELGLSDNDEDLAGAYRRVQDEEIAYLTLSVPIVDWGLSRGKVKMAKAEAETTKNSLEQDLIDYRQDVFVQVMQFNNQRQQCEISKRAADIAEESYELALKNFGKGTLSVTDLNSLQNDKDEALENYITNISNYWSYYFTVRQTTLYDYLSGKNISAEFDKMVK